MWVTVYDGIDEEGLAHTIQYLHQPGFHFYVGDDGCSPRFFRINMSELGMSMSSGRALHEPCLRVEISIET